MTPNAAEAIFAYASDQEVSRYTIWDMHRSVEDSRAFLEHVLGNYERGEGSADWGIVYKGDGRLVGTCAIQLGADNACAELGYVIHREYWGRGLVPEAVRAMIAFGFERMGLNRIEARCIVENTASARVMEKAGMTYEGTLRQQEFIKGAYRDMKLYAILKSEFSRR